MSALSASLTHAPAADTDAVVTLAAQPGGWRIRGLVCSYSATPDAGCKVTIEAGETVVFQAYVSSAGPAPIEFPGAVEGPDNVALTVTLEAGGTGILGAINVIPA